MKKIVVFLLILLLVGGVGCTKSSPTEQAIQFTAAEQEVIDKFCTEHYVDPKTMMLSKTDWTILHAAAYYGNLEVVKILVSKGKDVNVKTEYHGDTPLALAASSGHVEVVKLLVSAGADVNAKDNNGQTPLYLAMRHEDVPFIRLLVSAGADINVKDKDGKTPLDEAKRRGNIKVVKYLSGITNKE